MIQWIFVLLFHVSFIGFLVLSVNCKKKHTTCFCSICVVMMIVRKRYQYLFSSTLTIHGQSNYFTYSVQKQYSSNSTNCYYYCSSNWLVKWSVGQRKWKYYEPWNWIHFQDDSGMVYVYSAKKSLCFDHQPG